MSSSAHLTYDMGEEIALDRWEHFAADNALTFDPHVVGQDTYRHARLPIEVRFGEKGYRPPPGPDGRIDFTQCTPPAQASRIVISTYFGSAACSDVAALAVAAWRELGGSLAATPEIRCFVRADTR